MLDSRQRALRERLESFVIGTGDEPVSFARRLARENAWTSSHAERVVREYLRFVFLCAESGHSCTPSDAVDQAWHLHLMYTWSYWNELCPLLPHPLHHGPTKGGAEEDTKHDEWYARTLESYRRLFGEEPPSDIWPATYEPDEETVRISRRGYWLFPRRVARTALGAVSLALGGCALDSDAALPLLLILLVILVVAFSSADSRRPRRRYRGDSGGDYTEGGGSSDLGGHDGGHHGGHDSGGHGGHGCGGHGCGGHGCGGHGCGSH